MGGTVKTFVIHLERATARRAQVAQLLDRAPFPADVLIAVDGSALSDWPVARRFQPRYPFSLGPGEVGCFLSHRLAWQRMLDEGLEAALILEDDVALEDGFADAARFAAENAGNFGYIQFQTRLLADPVSEVARRDELSIVRPRLTPLRTSAQLVHRDAARRLLQVTETFDRPIDVLLQMHWETGVRLHVVQPSRVSDKTAETGGSTISGKRRGIFEKIARSFHRHRYRSAISRLSRRNDASS